MLALSTIAFASVASASEIVLASFDGSKTQRQWREQNDPVMGGRSTGTFTVQNGRGVFNGTCAIVPKLSAPGFIKASAGESPDSKYPDITKCDSIALTFQNIIDYDGFRFSFGNTHPKGGKFFASGYKASLGPIKGLAPGAPAQEIILPFKQFTDFWDDATGLPIHTCADDPQYCPNTETLQDMKTMSIWAEGKEGDVHMEIQKISAVHCSGSE